MYTQRSTGRTIRDTMLTDLNDLFFFASVVDHRDLLPAGRALGIPNQAQPPRGAAGRAAGRAPDPALDAAFLGDRGRPKLLRALQGDAGGSGSGAAGDRTDARRALRHGACRARWRSCTRVGSMVAAFMADYPKVTVHLEATNRRVDVGEGVGSGDRVRPPPLEDSDLVLKIGAAHGASPPARRWCAPSGRRTPEDLRKYPTLDLGPGALSTNGG